MQPASNPTFDPQSNRIAAGQSYGTDAAGNVAIAPGYAFSFDAENRIVSSNYAAPNQQVNANTYSYDGDGRRVKKVAANGQETTIFVYGASGELVAEYGDQSVVTASEMSYLTSDTLGTPRISTRADGSVKSRHDYLPFGEELTAGIGGRTTAQGYSQPDNIRQKWAGKEYDGETGLSYFGARYMSSAQGRFTSVDPVKVNKARMLDPQRFNLYAYVRNNPLQFLDPDGRDIYLDNNNKEGRRKALLKATETLTTAEQQNIGSRKTTNGRVELYVKDPNKINLDKASAGYKYLTSRINDHDIQIGYTLLSKGQSVVAGDGRVVSQRGLANDAGGVTIGLGSGKVQVIVAEGGVPHGVKGLTASGEDVQIAFPDNLVTAHEMFGETLKYTRGNERLQGEDFATRAEDSRRVIGIENEIRDDLGLPHRSGKDHSDTADFGEVTVRP